MIQKVIRHSKGMVSVDAEKMDTNQVNTEYLKGTNFFKLLSSIVGETRANEIIEKGTRDYPASEGNPDKT